MEKDNADIMRLWREYVAGQLTYEQLEYCLKQLNPTPRGEE